MVYNWNEFEVLYSLVYYNGNDLIIIWLLIIKEFDLFDFAKGIILEKELLELLRNILVNIIIW